MKKLLPFGVTLSRTEGPVPNNLRPSLMQASRNELDADLIISPEEEEGKEARTRRASLESDSLALDLAHLRCE
jgi:hypothetical protein